MKWLLIGAYLFAVLYVHFRGRVRLPFVRQLIDHSSLMAPVNVFMYLCSKPPTSPFIPLGHLPELVPLCRHWEAIRAEAEHMRALRHTFAAVQEEEGGADAPLGGDWQHVHLKWYDTAQPLGRCLCPRTVALLQAIPSIKVANFVELPAGARLTPHRDPYAGFLRFHLGLATPGHDGCFIEVDGQRHVWRDGEAMLFDETYIHWAVNEQRNGQGSGRLILLCDIERPMRWGWAQAVNHVLGQMIASATNPPQGDGEAVGQGQRGPHRLHGIVRGLGDYRRRLKSWNMTVYRMTVVGTIAALGAVLYIL